MRIKFKKGTKNGVPSADSGQAKFRIFKDFFKKRMTFYRFLQVFGLKIDT